MTDPIITSVPLVSIPGRSIAIVPDPDPAYTGHAFYTIDVNADGWGGENVAWWEMPGDVRRHADHLADSDEAGADLWAAVADIIEKASG